MQWPVAFNAEAAAENIHIIFIVVAFCYILRHAKNFLMLFVLILNHVLQKSNNMSTFAAHPVCSAYCTLQFTV